MSHSSVTPEDLRHIEQIQNGIPFLEDEKAKRAAYVYAHIYISFLPFTYNLIGNIIQQNSSLLRRFLVGTIGEIIVDQCSDGAIFQ